MAGATTISDPQPLRVRIECRAGNRTYGAKDNVTVVDFARAQFQTAAARWRKPYSSEPPSYIPRRARAARFACAGPAPACIFLGGWRATAGPVGPKTKTTFPKPLHLAGHRALGLSVKGDEGGEVLDIRMEFGEAAYLHHFQPITFTGWKYCELGQPESDRVMDYSTATSSVCTTCRWTSWSA